MNALAEDHDSVVEMEEPAASRVCKAYDSEDDDVEAQRATTTASGAGYFFRWCRRAA